MYTVGAASYGLATKRHGLMGARHMAYRGQKEKEALVDRLARRARRKLGRGKGVDGERFVRHYFRHVPPEDMLSREVDDLLGAALSLWSFLQTRKPAAPAIRVFNPERKRDGWQSAHTVIEVVNDDMPFLVDSLTAELNRHGLTVHLIVHPVVRVRRGTTGRLLGLADPDRADPGSVAESAMHIEINEQTLPETLDVIAGKLLTVLGDVRAAVEDWRAMRVGIADVVAELDSDPPPLAKEEVDEAKAFLRWLDDNNFTFLGYREYQFSGPKNRTVLQTTRESGLGVLRDPSTVVFEGMVDKAVLPPDIAAFLRAPSLILVSKANRRSTVHRATHLDTIGVKRHDKSGRVIGERLFVGLFTSEVYNQSVREIPLLRRKVDYIIEQSGFSPLSHDGKGLLNILETLPRDDLLQFAQTELFDTALGILHLQERQRLALFVRRDPFGRYASCLIFVPRERYTTDLRRRMQEIVEEGFAGKVAVYYIHVSESPLARLQFIVKTTPGEGHPATVEEVEARLAEAGRDWADDLSHALTAVHGEGRGLDLLRIYGNAFPVDYRARIRADEALADVEKLQHVHVHGTLAMDLYRPRDADRTELRFKIFNRGDPVPLSSVLPMLENMGLLVVGEIPHCVNPRGADTPIWLHDFEMLTAARQKVDLDAVKPIFEDAFARVWAGEMENDGFNRLVLAAGLSARQVVVLRAYCRYLRQAAIPFSENYMAQTLVGNPHIARMLVALFEALFDPDEAPRAGTRTTRLRVRIEEALDAVENLDEDRILRRFNNVIEATLRTNYFQLGVDGGAKPYVSFKIDSHRVDDLPLPRPMVEIFVYSPRVEAVHLRGGKVARGGIRWSDRREDFRTEILGLMKAQMTKNAVIVPVGAKGGFVVKRPPAEGGREAFVAEGIACYQTMMRGLLDITDNRTPDGTVYPERVIRRDDDDPYLVVAADKGTATFSDIANEIAREYGFWLDDAFASGGSAGYDHKKMGITARGAWESVKRHFREIGKDIQTTPFSCVGIGDMAGDVFGNGMLNSRFIRLVGAFNHLHIFVDPDPDPAAGYRERKRLFRLAGAAGWTDYDTKLISKGGGVFDRRAKSIRISPQIKQALELRKDSVTPNELIAALLRAPVELLWFGGIGTYVKSRAETHAEVGDRANDAVRIDAGTLRCQVVGEGANLGFTQLGRIEYGEGGGRINTDAIDNSAGVAASDHEVNIKILLGEVMAATRLSIKARNKLLVEMTDEVGELVLIDNYRQSMAITHAETETAARLDEYARFMRGLERAGKLDRSVEFLPDDETLEERRAARKGLVRPELAVLLAYAKITLYEDVLESDLPDEPYLMRDVGLYFPKPLRARYGDFIPRHRLRREISATYVTNSLINRTRPSFIDEVMEIADAAVPDIVRAYLMCREVYDLHTLWTGIEALDNKVPAAAQTEMNLEIIRLIKRGTLWFLANATRPFDILRNIEQFHPGVSTLAGCLDAVASPDLLADVARRAETLLASQVPEAMARRIASLDVLSPACDIARIATGNGCRVEDVARIYYAFGARFGFEWLRKSAEHLQAETEWQRMAITALVDDLYAQQTALTTKVVEAAGGTEAAEAVIEAWTAANERAVRRNRDLMSELKTAGAVDLAMLAVANREMRGLIAA
jgi:glutamate dehydrogenase